MAVEANAGLANVVTGIKKIDHAALIGRETQKPRREEKRTS
jgi:hypothetical protein